MHAHKKLFKDKNGLSHFVKILTGKNQSAQNITILWLREKDTNVFFLYT